MVLNREMEEVETKAEGQSYEHNQDKVTEKDDRGVELLLFEATEIPRFI